MLLIVKRVLILLCHLVLIPLSFLWSCFYGLRRFLFSYKLLESHAFQVPIISVGNLTFGGTGKTPFILWLASQYERSGRKVVVLSRGYKSELEDSFGVLESQRRLGFNPEKYGDEAVLMARKLNSTVIIVGKKRADNLNFFFHRYRPDVVILDDGHQHLRIQRELDIVLFDATLPLEKLQVAPLGHMRESFAALQTGSVIIISKADQVSREKINLLKGKITPHISSDACIVEMTYRPKGFYNSHYSRVFDSSELRGKKVIALAAIGSPKFFFESLRSLGLSVIDEVTFADHHSFDEDDLEIILEKAKKESAYIITTEKDMVKLRRIVECREIYYLDIEIEFLSNEKNLSETLSRVCDF